VPYEAITADVGEQISAAEAPGSTDLLPPKLSIAGELKHRADADLKKVGSLLGRQDFPAHVVAHVPLTSGNFLQFPAYAAVCTPLVIAVTGEQRALCCCTIRTPCDMFGRQEETRQPDM
jgi:hypothetical protein